jgi:hypothetical protein
MISENKHFRKFNAKGRASAALPFSFDKISKLPEGAMFIENPGIPLVWLIDSLKNMPADLVLIRVDPRKWGGWL